MVTVTIDLPPSLEREFLASSRDMARDVKEAYALELYRQAKINHVELSQMLGLDRFETDAVLQRHGVTEGALTMEDLELQTEISRRVMGKGNQAMIVVADSSPLIVVHTIQMIDVLPALFGTIMVPPAVFAEIQNSRRDLATAAFFKVKPAWLTVQAPAQAASVQGLHRGELEALGLVAELHADFLLVDDRAAFREAVARQINAIGTIRVLEMAADRKFIDLRIAFDRIKQTDFWISHRLLDERLKRRGVGNKPV